MAAASRNAGAAKRQARYRERQELLAGKVDAFVDELCRAVDESGCSWFGDNLPEERQARVEELTKRVKESKIIAIRGLRGVVDESS